MSAVTKRRRVRVRRPHKATDGTGRSGFLAAAGSGETPDAGRLEPAAAASPVDIVPPLDFASAGGSWSISVKPEPAGAGNIYAEREDPEALALALWNEGLKDDALAFVERQIALAKTLGEAAYVAIGPYASHSAPAALAIDAEPEIDAAGEFSPPGLIANDPEPIVLPAGVPAVVDSAGSDLVRRPGWARDRRLRPALIAGLFAGAALLLAISMLSVDSGAELERSPDRLLAATDSADGSESGSADVEQPLPAGTGETATPAWLSTLANATGGSAPPQTGTPAAVSEPVTAAVQPPAPAAAPEPDVLAAESDLSLAKEPTDGEVPAVPPASDAGAMADSVDSLTVGSINPLPSEGLPSAPPDGGSAAAAEPRVEVLDSYPADPASAAVVDLPPEMLEPELTGAAAALESGPEVETAQPPLQPRVPSPRPEPGLAALPIDPELAVAAVPNDPEPQVVDLPPDAPVLLGRPLRPGLAARRLAAERYAARRRAMAEWNAAAEGGPVLLGRPGVRY